MSKVNSTLDQRAATHGDYVQMANLTQALMANMRFSKNWDELFPPQQEALHMIAVKIARILEGNAEEPDHWHDVAGYAMLAEDFVKKVAQQPED